MKAAVLYARFSPRRHASECESCDRQLEQLRRWAHAMERTIIGEFRDDAISGKTADRPGLKAALDLATSRKAAIVVAAMSRLGRNTRELLEIRERLEKSGADLVSLKESIDTTGPAGRLVYTMLAAIDTMERERIAERTSEAMRAHQAAGRRMSARPPFGYRRDVHRESAAEAAGNAVRAFLEPDPSEQATLAQIVEWRASGLGIAAIRHRLMDRGSTIRGRAWTRTDLYRILERVALNPLTPA